MLGEVYPEFLEKISYKIFTAFIRDQLRHKYCWVYAVLDTINAHLQIHGDEKEFIPLSAHHLSRNACHERLMKEGEYETRGGKKYCCFGYARKTDFKYVMKNGIPREAECDVVYDCLKGASISADDEKLYTIDGNITYETLDDVFEALRTHSVTAALVCYTGNGIDAGYDGYLLVSLDVMVKTLGMSHDPKALKLDKFKKKCSSKHEHLLTIAPLSKKDIYFVPSHLVMTSMIWLTAQEVTMEEDSPYHL
ncbi:unnamed protein product [Cochlearia groenlandica]